MAHSQRQDGGSNGSPPTLDWEERGADDERVLKLRNEIENAVQEEAAEGANFSYRELLKGGKSQNLRRILLCWAVQAFQQLSGINLITYYAPGKSHLGGVD